jgi:hypothetical protein
MSIRKSFGILLLTILGITQEVFAQDCRCLVINKPTVNKKESTVVFKIKNNCNRRIWFYTKGFWLTVSDASDSSVQSRKLYKLAYEGSDFHLFKWKEEKQLTFHTDKIQSTSQRVHLSYSNTTYSQPKRLFGSATYLCEVDFPDVE